MHYEWFCETSESSSAKALPLLWLAFWIAGQRLLWRAALLSLLQLENQGTAANGRHQLPGNQTRRHLCLDKLPGDCSHVSDPPERPAESSPASVFSAQNADPWSCNQISGWGFNLLNIRKFAKQRGHWEIKIKGPLSSHVFNPLVIVTLPLVSIFGADHWCKWWWLIPDSWLPELDCWGCQKATVSVSNSRH